MRTIPRASIARYSTYYRVAKLLEQKGVEWATSFKLGLGDGVKPMQIRKDLSYIDIVGTRGRGYKIRSLRKNLEQALGLDRQWNVCVIGTSEMGSEWAAHTWYQKQGFPVRAVFDNDPEIVGQDFAGHTVLPLTEFEREVNDRSIDIALIATPTVQAQYAADAAVASGIKAVVCLNEASVEVPDDVYFNALSAFVDLADLSSFVCSGPGFRAPEVSIERLARYHSCLTYLMRLGVDRITSEHLGLGRGINAAQIRKDLSFCGALGRPGYGYDVAEVRTKLGQALGLNNERSMVFVGAGRLCEGMLYRRSWFESPRCTFRGVFDRDESKIGKKVAGFTIQPMSQLRRICASDRVKIAFLTTTPQGAQDACNHCVEAGIRGIINFTEASLGVPETVLVKDTNFLIYMTMASFHLTALRESLHS